MNSKTDPELWGDIKAHQELTGQNYTTARRMITTPYEGGVLGPWYDPGHLIESLRTLPQLGENGMFDHAKPITANHLVDHAVVMVNQSADFLRMFTPMKSTSDFTTYSAKHAAELMFGDYVGNWHMTLAAHVCGFPMVPDPSGYSPNSALRVSRKEWRFVTRRVRTGHWQSRYSETMPPRWRELAARVRRVDLPLYDSADDAYRWSTRR